MTLRPLASQLVGCCPFAGCQSVDVKPAQPSLLPAQQRAASGPACAPECCGGEIFTTTIQPLRGSGAEK